MLASTVAYDLRYACDHFPGIGTHAHLLLQALLDEPGDERYVVIWTPALLLLLVSATEVAVTVKLPRLWPAV